MEPDVLEKYKAWFTEYARRHYGRDDYVNFNLKLKEDHTHRVCDEMRWLADELRLDEALKLTSEAVALFHDIGRFEQFAKYRTYHDPKSIDHGRFGVEVLCTEKALWGITPAERRMIEQAVLYHGIKELPSDLAGDTLLLARMIRDADKLDIYRVVIEAYKNLRDNPGRFQYEQELPDLPECSEHIIDSIIAGRRIDYRTLRTWNDMKLCGLGWVHDVNFVPTLRRIRERKYLELVLEFLPDTPAIRRVREVVFKHIDARIAAGV